MVWVSANSLELTDSCEIVVVDIPIGLPEGKEPRLCDLQVRERLGKDGSNRVFLAPPRKALGVEDCEGIPGHSQAIDWGRRRAARLGYCSEAARGECRDDEKTARPCL